MPTNDPQTEMPTETGLEATPEPAPLINFEDPIAEADQVAVVADNPQAQAISEKHLAELHAAASRENAARDFTNNVLAARAKANEPPPPPAPVPPQIQAQTNAEMEAGRQAVAKHAAQMAKYPRPPVEDETRATPVFRPSDYVPDPKKNQGQTQARNL